jgi:hypothetical protein
MELFFTALIIPWFLSLLAFKIKQIGSKQKMEVLYVLHPLWGKQSRPGNLLSQVRYAIREASKLPITQQFQCATCTPVLTRKASQQRTTTF